jgi:hypothetical protein
MPSFGLRSLIALLAAVTAGCASMKNTSAQDLAWERYEACRTGGQARVNVTRVDRDGQIWFKYQDPDSKNNFLECNRRELQKQRAAGKFQPTYQPPRPSGEIKSPPASSAQAPVAPPSESQADATAAESIKVAYFTKNPPAASTIIKGDLSNAPSRADTFDARQDPRVVFFYGIVNQSKRLNLELWWLDPSGAVVDKVKNTDDHTRISSSWRWYTSVLPIDLMTGNPGRWRIQLWAAGVLAGEYAFELTGTQIPEAPAIVVEAPRFKAGDKWILSDGVREVIQVSDLELELTQGQGRHFYYTNDLRLRRMTENGKTILEFDPPYPSFQWPLRVGLTWTYDGRLFNAVTGFNGPTHASFRVMAYEPVTTPAGTFNAFKLVASHGTYWYSPEVRFVIRSLRTSSSSILKDFELVALATPSKTAPAASGNSPTRIGQALSPQDLQPYYANSWAVVVGIDHYMTAGVPRLRYAVADARAVAQALPGLGFAANRVLLLENAAATKAELERAIYGRIAEMEKDDRLLLFFAGHGEVQSIRGGQEGYLLPYDADPNNLPLTALPMRELAQIGRRLPVKHVLFALDNCFSGYAATRGVSGRTTGAPLSVLTTEPVVQILTAGTHGQVAVEDSGHGIFTKHFLKGLEGWADPEGGGLTALKLATFIQERVVRESAGRQTPQYGKLDGEGEFLFRPPRR